MNLTPRKSGNFKSLFIWLLILLGIGATIYFYSKYNKEKQKNKSI